MHHASPAKQPAMDSMTGVAPLARNDGTLINKVETFVCDYMSRYDPSHDFSHVQRVVRLAQQISSEERSARFQRGDLPLDDELVLLAALMHDVADHKYAKPTGRSSADNDGQGAEAGADDPKAVISDTLISFGATPTTALAVRDIVTHVSWSHEQRDPASVLSALERHPELGAVQDADRLDAIGAVGLGRAFSFGAAKGRPMVESVRHMREKLVKLEGNMKTEAGRHMARERTKRVEMLMEWWREETGDEI